LTVASYTSSFTSCIPSLIGKDKNTLWNIKKTLLEKLFLEYKNTLSEIPFQNANKYFWNVLFGIQFSPSIDFGKVFSRMHFLTLRKPFPKLIF